MKNDMLFNVENEIVVITGVGGQLGDQYAKTFLERGATVIGLDLNSNLSTGTLEIEYSDTFFFYIADVTKKTTLEKVLNDVVSTIGAPTVLINNAAIDSPPDSPAEENGPFEDYPESSWDNVMNVNLKGVFNCCQVFGGSMAKTGRGSIINIASIYGVVSPDQSIYDYRRKRGEEFYKPVAYSVSKSGIINLTRYLSVYWGRQSVRVNTLTIAGVFNNQEEEFLNVYCNRIPIGKMANEDDYNGSILFLASSASGYMTGSNLVIDGGWTAI